MTTLIETEPPTLAASNATGRTPTVTTRNTRGVPPRLPIAHREDTPEATEAYASLMRKAMDNDELVEQLVANELRLSPGLPRVEAIERANNRWNRELPALATATATNGNAPAHVRIVCRTDLPDAADTRESLPLDVMDDRSLAMNTSARMLDRVPTAWIADRQTPATTTTRHPGPNRRADFLDGVWAAPAPHESLLLKAMGDKSLVERLIGYELRRMPGIARAEAIERANDRWNRDLSR
jgi:hypothetical protein